MLENNNNYDNNLLYDYQDQTDNVINQNHKNNDVLISSHRNQQKSIWQKMHDTPHNSNGIALHNMKQPTDSWADLKLSLSYPCTERDSVIKSQTPIVYPTNNNNGNNGGGGGNGNGINGGNNDNLIDKNSKYYKNKLKFDMMPDAIRIGLNIQDDINNIQLKKKYSKSSRESLAAQLLLGENKHNLINNEKYRLDNGINNNLPMMQTLGTGQGTKSLLNLKTINLDKKHKNLQFRDLGLQNSESNKLLSSDSQKEKIIKMKILSKTLQPLIRGLKKSQAKLKYLEEVPLSSTAKADWTHQTTLVLKQALSLNLSVNY